MFTPKTERLAKLAAKYPRQIAELENLFSAPTNIYIDYANVLGWCPKLGWHIDIRRLKRLLDSFDTVKSVKFYYGTLVGDARSEKLMAEVAALGYDRRTKPVKIMRLPINAASIAPDSPDILRNFISKPLLNKLKVQSIEYLNSELRDLNRQGIYLIEEFKCNFDVELGRDMLIDYSADPDVRHVVLWSGDSDFADSLLQVLTDGRQATLFGTAQRIAKELNDLVPHGLYVFDIQKIRDFICMPKEMSRRL